MQPHAVSPDGDWWHCGDGRAFAWANCRLCLGPPGCRLQPGRPAAARDTASYCRHHSPPDRYQHLTTVPPDHRIWLRRPVLIGGLRHPGLATVNRHAKGTPDRRPKGTPSDDRDGSRCSAHRSRRRRWAEQRGRVVVRGAGGRGQARFLNRQLSFPVSTISQWWVRRSRSAVVILASPNTLGHSPKARLVVTITEVCS